MDEGLCPFCSGTLVAIRRSKARYRMFHGPEGEPLGDHKYTAYRCPECLVKVATEHERLLGEDTWTFKRFVDIERYNKADSYITSKVYTRVVGDYTARISHGSDSYNWRRA